MQPVRAMTAGITRIAACTLGLFLALPVLSSSSASPARRGPNASAVLQEINKVSARKFLDDLIEQNDIALDGICAEIVTGDRQWLEVARELKPGADGFIAESLNYSVARALPRAPEAVLGLIGHGFRLEEVCTSPFNEPDPGVAEAYEREAATALRGITSPEMKSARDHCLERISRPPK